VVEVGAPAPQHRVEPVGERSMSFDVGERPYLVDDRVERFLRRVGVDGSFAASALPGAALDAPAQEVEALVDVADPRLRDRRRPIGASTRLTSSQSASASSRLPATITTKSYA
jgi:hypothetical protein